MLEERENHTAVARGGYIYVTGGIHSGVSMAPTRSSERYDPKMNRWEHVDLGLSSDRQADWRLLKLLGGPESSAR